MSKAISILVFFWLSYHVATATGQDLISIPTWEGTPVFTSAEMVVRGQAPSPPTQPTSVFDQRPPSGDGFGWLNNVFSSATRSYMRTAQNSAFVYAVPDTALLLNQLPGAGSMQNTTIHNQPKVSGLRHMQAPGKGSYWFPARQDMDTLLSKIHPSLVGNLVTLKGPYSALYGPGLAYHIVEMIDTPRYEGLSFQSNGSTSIDYETNGKQWHGRQTFWGGASDWGFHVGYGHRTGNDYEAGNGDLMPSSYNSRDFHFFLGGDLTENSTLELKYLRNDQTDVEFPNQFFDLDYLTTDGFEFEYNLENQPLFDALSIEAWYNRTRFEGNNFGNRKRFLIPRMAAFGLFSETDADAMSTGYRAAGKWNSNFSTLTAGADYRYLKQSLNELNRFGTAAPVNNPIPDSHSANPGLFLEGQATPSDRLVFTTGGRVDWVSLDGETGVPSMRTADAIVELEDRLVGLVPDGQQGSLSENFTLWSAFAQASWKLDETWTAEFGFARAMRAPTMTEMYADLPFIIGVPQVVFSSLLGNPQLKPERMWRIDAGISAQYENARVLANWHYSWINDYITLDELAPLSYGFVNTDLATISGVDLTMDLVMTDRVSIFSHIGYLEGRDQTRISSRHPSEINRASLSSRFSGNSVESLPAISPLESRIGVSLHEPTLDPDWRVQFTAEIVGRQDQFAQSLAEEMTAGYTIYGLESYLRLLDNLIMTLGVRNLTDKHYRTHFDPRNDAEVFRPGRSFYLGMQMTY